MYLHNWLAALLGPYSQYAWLAHGMIIILVASLFYYLQRSLIKQLMKYAQKTVYIWDDTLLQALALPLSVLIWVVAVLLSVKFMLLDLHQNDWSDTISLCRKAVSGAILVWFLWRYIDSVEYRLLHPFAEDRKKFDQTTVSVVGRFVRIGLLVVGALVVLGALGIPLTGLVAFGGGGAIVMGIAAQQLLANWFGGLMIFLDKPFKLGDRIQSPDREIEGHVTRIGWRTTKVMSLDNQPLYIPNALFNQVIIVNPGRMTHRHINTVIGIRYDDASVLKDLVKSIESMLRQHPNIDQRELVMVHFVNFGASSLDINIDCFTKMTTNPSWRDVRQDIFFKVIDIVQAHKAQFAFPTVTTHIPDGVCIKGDLRP